MSYQAMAWATEHKLPCTDKMVLLMLANRTNHETGRCFPSIDRLADDCGLGRTAIKSAIGRLEAAGLIEVIRRSTEGVPQPNIYRLQLHNRGELAPKANDDNRSPGDRVGREATGGRAPGDPKPGTQPGSSSTPGAKLDFTAWPTAPSPGPLEAWDQLRRKKRAPTTQVVVDRLAPELHKALARGWSVDDVLAECAMRGWQGFHADWLEPKEKPQPVRAGAQDKPPQGRQDYARRGQAGKAGGAIDRVLANIDRRRTDGETAAGERAGPDLGDDDGGLRA